SLNDDWKGESERGALPRLRLNPDFSSVHLNNALGYGQAQPSAALLAGDRIIGLLKLLKQLGLVGGGNARTGVADRDIECAIVCLGFDGNFAGIGELNSVADEINQDLRQTATVATSGRQFGRHLDLERKLFVCCQRLQCAADGLGNVLNGIIGEFEFKLASFDLRQIEHVIDESEQMPAIGFKALEYAEHLLGWLPVSGIRH